MDYTSVLAFRQKKLDLRAFSSIDKLLKTKVSKNCYTRIKFMNLVEGELSRGMHYHVLTPLATDVLRYSDTERMIHLSDLLIHAAILVGVFAPKRIGSALGLDKCVLQCVE